MNNENKPKWTNTNFRHQEAKAFELAREEEAKLRELGYEELIPGSGEWVREEKVR